MEKNVNLMNMLETPILFIIFNRPDTTQKVFDRIKKVKPKFLFVAADGPRNDNESNLCQETRKIIKQIDWNCELKTLFQDNNLGCKIAVSTAITWFFHNVEEGIILEDDCLPSNSFFVFCEQLLSYYRNDSRVFMISGANFSLENNLSTYSYYFSKHSYIWGWATWRRAWKYYDINLKSFSEFKNTECIKNIFHDKKEQEFWIENFQKAFDNKINTWDYQWYYTMLSQNGLSVVPNANLVVNIGFGANSTHTSNNNIHINSMELNEINKIVHPELFIPNSKADKFTFDNVYYTKMPKRIKNKIARFFK